MANPDLFQKTDVRDILSAFSHHIEDRTGRRLDDIKWPNRLMYFHLINQRASLYYKTRKINKQESNYEDYNEVLRCVEMKRIDWVECPCAPPKGCYWIKSVDPLPAFIGSKPTKVTTLDGFNSYDYIDWDKFSIRMNNRVKAVTKGLLYTQRTIDTHRHIYTYITNDIEAESIMVAGVPVDPIEMFLFPICGKVPEQICSYLDIPFVIEKRLMDDLFKMTYSALIGISNNGAMPDTKNDDRNTWAAGETQP